MMDVITGKTRPDEGSAFFGQTIDLTRLSEAEIRARRHRPQVPEADHFRAAQRIREPRAGDEADKRVRRSLFSKLTSAQRDSIAETLKLIRLDDSADRVAGLLSHGQKQWLEIGMLLMQEPRLLLLDEPVAGMSDDETERTAELFLSLAGKHSLVVVEHDMAFIEKIARKVTVLHEGSVLAEGPMHQVQNDPKVIEVYLGR
jgi:urea transport system ATP-binding protein